MVKEKMEIIIEKEVKTEKSYGIEVNEYNEINNWSEHKKNVERKQLHVMLKD